MSEQEQRPEHHAHHHHGRQRRGDPRGPDGPRRDPGESAPEQPADAEAPRILVDAANVAFFNRDEPGARGSVDNLLRMKDWLVRLGYRPIFIADAALKHKVDEPERLDHLERAGEILQAPAGTQADYFLLAFAQRENLPVVSNDVYRDREQEFPGARRHRVPFMIVDGEVVIDREHLPPGAPASAAQFNQPRQQGQ